MDASTDAVNSIDASVPDYIDFGGKLLASDGAYLDGFGGAVATNGATIAVGASNRDTSATDTGAIYLFEQQLSGRWLEVDTLITSDAGEGDSLGHALAMSQDFLVAGAYADDEAGTDAGAAYVFERTATGWVEHAKLIGSTTVAGDRLGHSVAMAGTTIVVGTREHDQRKGAAYVFELVNGTWQETGALLANDGQEDDTFGHAVAVNGDHVAVGAPSRQDFTGAVYIFERQNGTWQYVDTLLAAETKTGDQLGISITMTGTLLIAGAQFGAGAQASTGNAPAFELRSGIWSEVGTMAAPDGQPGERFGISAAQSGSVSVLGAVFDADRGVSAGSIYIFQSLGTAGEILRLIPFDVDTDDWFGLSVAMSGDIIVAGAPYQDEQGYESGAAYVFEMTTSQ